MIFYTNINLPITRTIDKFQRRKQIDKKKLNDKKKRITLFLRLVHLSLIEEDKQDVVYRMYTKRDF